MKHKLILLTAIACTLVFAACTKHPGDIEAPVATATITFDNPTEGAVYQTGDSVRIQGLAIAAAVMHGYEVSIKDAADTSVVYFSEHIHAHNDTLVINHAWANTLTTAANLQVELIVTLDHDGNSARKTAGIKTAGQ